MKTLQIILRNEIVVPQLPHELVILVKGRLTINNPAFVSALKFGRSTRGLPKYLRFYRDIGETFFIPRGFYTEFLSICHQMGFAIEETDETVSFEPQEIKQVKLRDYQVPWVDDLMAETGGIGVAAPGAGKTASAISIYAKLGQPCLWLTHTRGLAHQAIERLREYTGVEAGFIGSGKVNVKHFTVGLIPTLAKRDLTEYAKSFGLIILDECFPAGTKVDGKNIEDIKIGDVVSSFNETTGIINKNRVVKLYKSKAKGLVRIMVSSGTSIVCTPGHPVWTRQGWKPAFALTSDDEVLNCRHEEGTVSFWARVDFVEILEQDSTGTFGGMCPGGYVYNIEVENDHTYIANNIVVHNCHHAPAESFYNVTNQFHAKYRYGLTATPFRDDGLEDMMFHAFGPPRAWLERGHLRELGFLMTPTVYRKHSAFTFPYNSKSKKFGYKAMEEAMSQDVARNAMILGDVLVEAFIPENTCIILVGRVEHGETLFKAIDEIFPSVGLVHSKMPPKKGDQVMKDFSAGKIKILIATYRMLAEGFDYPPANRLFLTAPFKGRILIEQACGRVERIADGKKDAKIFDYVDDKLLVLRNQAEIRRDVYEANDTPVINLD